MLIRKGDKKVLSVIYSEILKLKRSNILFLILIGGLTMPLILDIAIVVLSQENRTFESYVYNTEGLSYMFIYGILFSIISGYIFTREYGDKTANSLYSYSCDRTKIFMGKLIVIYFIMFITCCIQCITVYAGYYKLFGNLDSNLILNDLKINVQALLFQMALVPIPIFLANLKKNIILPIIYGVFSLCIQAITSGSNSIYVKYNPLLGSLFIFENTYNKGNNHIGSTVVVSVFVFIVFMAAAFYGHKKMDIN